MRLLDMRDGRGLAWLGGMALDFRLAARMLVKYPGLSVIAVAGMSVGIAIGAGGFGWLEAMLDPTLPFDEAERIVSIQTLDTRTHASARQELHDLALWRDEAASLQEVGAYRNDTRNLILPGRSVELVQLAEISAVAFRATGVPMHLGRPLLDEDESAGAPDVVIIGFDEWQRTFAGDSNVLGGEVRLGNAVHTIVGVAAEGFRFPIDHGYWVPLRLNASDYAPGSGPTLELFGRLADSVTREQAQAELTVLGQRIPRDHADGQLVTYVQPYTHAWLGADVPMIAVRVWQALVGMLLVLVAANVAILIYARTAMRIGEIAVRSALGASRRRIAAQLFLEAFMLSGIAAAVGLGIAALGFAQVEAFWDRTPGAGLPFWFELRLSARVVVYALGLAVLAAVIAGVLPALRATGRSVQPALQMLHGAGAQLQLGRTWTALIVVQVALAVAVLPAAIYNAIESIRFDSDPGYPAAEFVRAVYTLESMETPPTEQTSEHERAHDTRFVDRAARLVDRLEREPGVAAVTLARHYPGTEPGVRIEVDDAAMDDAPQTVAPAEALHWVHTNAVRPDLFEVFGVPVLAGRAFTEDDAVQQRSVALVSRELAGRIDPAGRVVGRRLREVTGDEVGDVHTGPWLEIVGVVADFPAPPFTTGVSPKMYRPTLYGGANELSLAVRTRGVQPTAVAQRLRAVAAGIDPAIELHGLETLEYVRRQEQQAMLFYALGIIAIMGSTVLLSAAGIYAMMSFTVARRRREIGIRAALGASRRRVLTGVFARATAQLGAGVAVGLGIAAAVITPGDAYDNRVLTLLAAVCVLMFAVGLLAALGPARRGLAVQPSEALRSE